jgi:hypothetical protein
MEQEDWRTVKILLLIFKKVLAIDCLAYFVPFKDGIFYEILADTVFLNCTRFFQLFLKSLEGLVNRFVLFYSYFYHLDLKMFFVLACKVKEFI